jgi:hypothetical protein
MRTVVALVRYDRVYYSAIPALENRPYSLCIMECVGTSLSWASNSFCRGHLKTVLPRQVPLPREQLEQLSKEELVEPGLGRTVALHRRPSTSYQIR